MMIEPKMNFIEEIDDSDELKRITCAHFLLIESWDR